jgi:Tfp pilus assembly protein PilF
MGVANNRAGWVALITASGFFFFLMVYQKHRMKPSDDKSDTWDRLYSFRKVLLLSVIGIAVAGALVLGQYYSSRSDVAVKGRLLHWKTSMMMFKDAPWFGQGPGNYFTTYLSYQGNVLHDPANTGFLRVAREVQSMNTAYAHNEYIQSLTDTGIFGFLSFMLVVVIFIWLGYLQFKRLKSMESAGLYLGCFTGGLALLSASKFGYPLHVPASGMVFWFLLGAVSAIGNWEKDSMVRREFWPEWITGQGIMNLTRTSFFLVIITVLWVVFVGWRLPKAYQNYQCSLKIREGRYYAETLGDMNQAVNSMGQAVHADPTNGLAHYFLGGYYAKQERYQDAIREYNQATSNYNDQRIYFNLAQIYFNLKDFAKAEEHYKMTLWLNDRNAMSYRQLGLIYASRNDYPVSLEYFQRYLALQNRGPEAEQIKDIVRQIEAVMKSTPAADTTGGKR